jgi:hypothetical protein
MILMLKDQKVASLLFGSSGNRVSGMDGAQNMNKSSRPVSSVILDD